MPPLTASTCPVIYDASSEARKQRRRPRPPACPAAERNLRRPIACAFSVIALVMSVSISPGATTFTVMFRDATSRASALLKPIRPAFDAA